MLNCQRFLQWRSEDGRGPWTTECLGPLGGGGSFTKIVRGCACRTSKIWLSLYQFFAKFPTHQYTIFGRKAPNLDQIGCFLQQFAQNTPNLCNLGSFVSDENPPIAIPNFTKRCPKRQAHIRKPCQCENPPGGPSPYFITLFLWPLPTLLLNTI